MKRYSGFTLIETLIVVLILGVLASAVTLSVAGVNARTDKAEAEKIFDVLSFARKLSHISNRSVRAIVDEHLIYIEVWTDQGWRNTGKLPSQASTVELDPETEILAYLDNSLDNSEPMILFPAGADYQAFELQIITDRSRFDLLGDGQSPIVFRQL